MGLLGKKDELPDLSGPKPPEASGGGVTDFSGGQRPNAGGPKPSLPSETPVPDASGPVVSSYPGPNPPEASGPRQANHGGRPAQTPDGAPPQPPSSPEPIGTVGSKEPNLGGPSPPNVGGAPVSLPSSSPVSDANSSAVVNAAGSPLTDISGDRLPDISDNTVAPSVRGEDNDAGNSTLEQAGLRGRSKAEKSEHDSLYDGVKGFSDYKEAKSSKTGKKMLKAQFSRKQRAKMSILSFLITGMLGIGGTFGGFALGPGQLVTFAENMKDFSFGPSETQTNKLTTRLYRRIYVKNPGDRDMGTIGRKMANNYEKALLENKGIELQRDSRGNLTGVKEGGMLTHDLSDEALGVRGDPEKLRGAQAQRRTILAETVQEGLDVGKFKYYTRYRNVMQKRFRVKFAVFENLDRKARVKAVEFFDKKFKPAVVDGDTEVEAKAKDKSDDADTDAEKKESAAKTEKTQADVDAGFEDSQKYATEVETKPARTKATGALKKGGKIGLSVVGLSALACTVKAVNDNVDKVAYAQRYVPLIRVFNFFNTMSDQLKSGDLSDQTLPTAEETSKDAGKAGGKTKKTEKLNSTVAMQELSEAAALLAPETEGANAGVSWIDSAPARRSYGSNWEGQPDVRKDLSPSPTTLAGGLSQVSKVLDKIIPGTLCSAISSSAGSFVMSAIDFATSATGPLGLAKYALSEGLSRAFADDVIDAIVSFASGPGLDLVGSTAIDLTGMAQAGGIGSNSESEKTEGGRPLSNDESLALRTDHIQERKREFASRPLKDRVFDYTHPDSIATVAITSMPKNKQQFASMIIGAPQKMLSSVAAIISPAVKAQQQGPCDGTWNSECLKGFDNYGIQDYGFTNEEISYLTRFNPDELLEWADGTENAIGTPPDSETRTKWAACFEAETEPKEGGSNKDGPVNSGGWSDECQGFVDNDSNRTFLAFRGALKYKSIQEGLECAASEDCPKNEAATNPTPEVDGATQTPGGAVKGRGTDTNCAAGTTDMGVLQFWEHFKNVPSVGCQIPGFFSQGLEDVPRGSVVTISAASSKQFLDMFNAAKADGITFRADSSFRTYEYQVELYNKYGQDSTVAAEPGNSNHNGGNAIDFLDMCMGVNNCPRDKRGGVYDKSMGCDKTKFIRSIDPSSKTWLWLEANAKRFGITQYCNEAWHWETKVYDGG